MNGVMWFVECHSSGCLAQGPTPSERHAAAELWNRRADHAELLAALVREHNANHPVDAGPACGCTTCVLLARLDSPPTEPSPTGSGE